MKSSTTLVWPTYKEYFAISTILCRLSLICSQPQYTLLYLFCSFDLD